MSAFIFIQRSGRLV